MQIAQQVPLLDIVASNADWTSDWIRVVPGSSVRGMVAITAIVGAPAGTARFQTMTAAGDPVDLFTLACAAVSSSSNVATCAGEYVRALLDQAGGGASLTMSLDIIIQPPDSTPA